MNGKTRQGTIYEPEQPWNYKNHEKKYQGRKRKSFRPFSVLLLPSTLRLDWRVDGGLRLPIFRFTIHDLRFTIHDSRFTICDLRFTLHASRSYLFQRPAERLEGLFAEEVENDLAQGCISLFLDCLLYTSDAADE